MNTATQPAPASPVSAEPQINAATKAESEPADGPGDWPVEEAPSPADPTVFLEGFEKARDQPSHVAEESGDYFFVDRLTGWTIRNLTASCQKPEPLLEIQTGQLYSGEAVPQGQAYAELDGYCAVAICRSFASTPGATYKVSFFFRSRDHSSQAATKLRVAVGRQVIFERAGYQVPLSWKKSPDTLTFKATAAKTTLEFGDYGTSDSLGVLIDAIRVELVP